MREVRVFVNTRPYKKLYCVKEEHTVVDINVPEFDSIKPYENINATIAAKKFTAPIQYKPNVGYYAEFYEEELEFDENGILRFRERSKK